MKMFVWIDSWEPSNRIAVLAATYEQAYDDATHAIKEASKSKSLKDTERYLRWYQSQYEFHGPKSILL